jgi:hypothetical protein
MVKNVSGGSKSKGIARKFANEPRSDRLVLSTCPDEQYAIVTNIYGGDRCAVITAQGLALQCVIRKKFRGRHRRTNAVAVGGYVLVGLRDFEAPTYKVCDLLEVYSKEEHARLANMPGADVHALAGIAATLAGAGAGAGADESGATNVVFATHADADADADADTGAGEGEGAGAGVKPETRARAGARAGADEGEGAGVKPETRARAGARAGADAEFSLDDI